MLHRRARWDGIPVSLHAVSTRSSSSASLPRWPGDAGSDPHRGAVETDCSQRVDAGASDFRLRPRERLARPSVVIPAVTATCAGGFEVARRPHQERATLRVAWRVPADRRSIRRAADRRGRGHELWRRTRPPAPSVWRATTPRATDRLARSPGRVHRALGRPRSRSRSDAATAKPTLGPGRLPPARATSARTLRSVPGPIGADERASRARRRPRYVARRPRVWLTLHRAQPRPGSSAVARVFVGVDLRGTTHASSPVTEVAASSTVRHPRRRLFEPDRHARASERLGPTWHRRRARTRARPHRHGWRRCGPTNVQRLVEPSRLAGRVRPRSPG